MKFETISIPDSEPLPEVNGIHHYPAKMATKLGEYFLSEYATDRSGKMFDPFAGSGTTLLLSRLYGFDVCGCEILEVAERISSVKSTTLSKEEIKEIEDFRDSYSIDPVDTVDSWENREIWFHDEVYQDLMAIRNVINQYEGSSIYPFLFVALSNVVWEVSSADPDILVPTRSKMAEDQPFYESEEILSKFEESINNILDLQLVHHNNGLDPKKPDIKQGDAKRKNTWPGGEYDLILTSPPYGDGINYRRSISLQTRFFGLDDQILDEKITKHTVGRKYYQLSESDDLEFDSNILSYEFFSKIENNNPERTDTVITYLNDMSIVLRNMRSKLSEEGIIGLVIGNPEVADTRVPLNELIIELAEDNGLELYDTPKKDEITNRFQTPVRRSSSEPIKYEYLITLERDT